MEEDYPFKKDGEEDDYDLEENPLFEKGEEEKEAKLEKKEREEKPLFKEKKEEKEEATIAITPMRIWQIATAVLAVLLIISIFTYGFRGAPTVTGTTVKETVKEAVKEPTPSPTEPKAEVGADDDPVKGPATAKITIIEFSDFQCPFCARAVPTMEQIFKTYGDKVRLVYRDFPLSFHQYAQKSAEAAECADEQGKFWEYHDSLFANQNALDIDSLKKYASDTKLDTAKFNECLDSGKYAEEVQKDFKDGQSAGVRGTPAFFINGRLVSGAQPFETFKKIIDEELAK